MDSAAHPDTAAALARLAAHPRPLPVRRTERLVLRPWREEDRAPFAALNADPEVTAYLAGPLDTAASDALIDHFRVEVARRGFGMFAVEERATRTFIGMVGLAVPTWEAPFLPGVEIGWRLARPFWGQGYAEEAARDVLSWAFETLRLPRLLSFTVAANTRSWGLMERLGLARVGTFTHPRLPADHPLSLHLLYALDAPVAQTAITAAPGAAPEPGPPAAPNAGAPPHPTAPAAAPDLPRVWIDGDGAPRAVKDLVWRAVERGKIAVTLVANRQVVVPRHRNVDTVVVRAGMDVADDYLVAHARPGDLVITSDVPLAAELVALGIATLGPRGDWFTPENVGERLSMRDFFTDARAAGMVEGGGPAAFDERTRRAFANGLDGWVQRAHAARNAR